MIKERLQYLRDYMRLNNVTACIIPSSDPHQSEYVATHWQAREWISGFTGSSGLIIVTLDNAGLWTDSRYFLQAEEQLAGTRIELHKVLKRSVPEHLYWLRDQITEGSTIAIDGMCFSKSQYDRIKKILSPKKITINTSVDFISEIWKDRPELPSAAAFSHDVKYCGLTRSEKLSQIRDAIKSAEAEYKLVSTLDDIAWVLNLRGSDIKLNPVVISYLIIGLEECYFFIDNSKLSEVEVGHLSDDKVHIEDYKNISDFLSKLDQESVILVDKYSTSISLYDKIKAKIKQAKKAIIPHLKGTKNEVECDNYRKCMVRDGVALTHAFMWLQSELKQEGGVTEFEFARKIAYYRSQQDHYHDESFDAIVGYKGNGAIIHYKPEQESCDTIANEGVLLVDSGGQYLDGTTDITRTISLDEPSEEVKQAYTCVLKGMIGLSQAIFPEGTTGAQLDILARQHLWSSGMNYLHGTGHGVGFFLNVHEGPQSISSGTTTRAQTPIVAGMVTSNEPGNYIENAYGIRIENLILCVPAKHDGFLQFETITYFPIETKSINFSLMTKQEINWLNDYHATVLQRLSPQLDETAKKWLAEKCRSI